MGIRQSKRLPPEPESEECGSPFHHDYGVPEDIDQYGSFIDKPRNDCSCFWPWPRLWESGPKSVH